MASQQDVEREAAALRNELFAAADSGNFPAEQQILFDLNQNVAIALRSFMDSPGDPARFDAAVAACAAARRALADLQPDDAARLQHLVRSVAAAVTAIEAATAP
jgi:hypothetical protein